MTPVASKYTKYHFFFTCSISGSFSFPLSHSLSRFSSLKMHPPLLVDSVATAAKPEHVTERKMVREREIDNPSLYVDVREHIVADALNVFVCLRPFWLCVVGVWVCTWESCGVRSLIHHRVTVATANSSSATEKWCSSFSYRTFTWVTNICMLWGWLSKISKMAEICVLNNYMFYFWSGIKSDFCLNVGCLSLVLSKKPS